LNTIAMPIHDVYSKRNSSKPISPKANEMPFALKNQIFHIWNDFLSQKQIKSDVKETAWKEILKSVCREHGFGRLIFENVQASKYPRDQVENYYQSLSHLEVDKHFDIIEIVFFTIRKIDLFYSKRGRRLPINYNACVGYLNQRFTEHAFPFRFEQKQIIKMDSEFHYSNVVKPTLELLKEEIFCSVNSEFLLAHEYYRKKLYEPCIVECTKSFESCLKIIGHALSWGYKQSDTASVLVRVAIDQQLIPKYFENSFMVVATIRNKTSAHGKGIEEVDVTDELALFSIHQTAAILYFLVESFKKRSTPRLLNLHSKS
jgi:hypothetical protein